MEFKRSPIFYMGNKYKLLPQLLPLFPSQCENFYDLFGGSGVVSLNYKGRNKTIYNEFNHNVVGLIEMIINNNPKELDEYYKNKIKEYNLETKSICKNEYHLRTDNFNRLREDYNKNSEKNYKDLYLLSVYSINHLIRFNSKDEFNVSSGNNSYNEKNYNQILDFHKSFKDVTILNKNIFDLNLDELTENDFVYCDPPYLNTEAVYNEKRAFGNWDINNDYKLFKILDDLNDRNIKFGLSNVFENRGIKNDHLIKWSKDHNYNVYHLKRNYNAFSSESSNSDEVYICNYKIENKTLNEKYELF